MAAYDAFLLVSFGGPEGREDVLPFLRNVTAGRNIPDERLAAVAEHYYQFGGVSPINQQCRDLVQAIGKDFEASGIELPVYWGNRNWGPYLGDTLTAMAADGVTRALAFATSAYSSYSSCRQYLEDIERARVQAGPAVPPVDKLTPYFGHPAFAASFVATAAEALAALPADVRDDADLVFTAHSIPGPMALASGPSGSAYPAQLTGVAAAVVAGLTAAGHPGRGPGGRRRAGRTWQVAYSSRSGPPSQPWLEPDVSDALTALAEARSRAVVVVPIGFVSDHMEVRFDLDVEAAQTAARLGLPFARAATPGTSPGFVSMITDLVRRAQSALASSGSDPVERPVVAPASGSPWCAGGCCAAGARPERAR